MKEFDVSQHTAPDPWRWQRWAFQQTTGNPGRKAVLSHLAMMADYNTGRCEAKQATIAHGVEVSERSVRTHLVSLEEAGLIARRAQVRRDRGRRGDEFLLLAPWVTEWPDGERIDHPADPARGGGNFDTPPTVRQSSGQELPPMNGHASKQERESAHDPREHPPEDFPDALRPHAREVYRILKAVAEQHGARKVWPQAVGRVLMAHPRHPLVAQAHALAAWAVDPPRPVKDVVGTYRSFLTRERELEATEHLAPDGTPASGKAPAGVTHLRPNASAEERRMERQRQRAAKIAEYDRAGSQPGHNGAMLALYPTTEEA